MVNRRFRLRQAGQISEAYLIVFQPLAVGTSQRHFLFDLLVADDAPLAGIDEKHSSRLEPAFFQNPFRWYVEDADLRRHNHQIVLGHVVARWAEPVSVEHRADNDDLVIMASEVGVLDVPPE